MAKFLLTAALSVTILAGIAAPALAQTPAPPAAPVRPTLTPEEIEERFQEAALDSVLSMYEFSTMFMQICHDTVEPLPVFPEAAAAYVTRNQAVKAEVDAIKVKMSFYHPGVDDQIARFTEVRVANQLARAVGEETHACQIMAEDMNKGVYDLDTYPTAIDSMERLRRIPH